MVSAAISLPLNGYCKPGRFFPILVDGEDLTHATLLSGNGCMSTSVEPQSVGRTIVPMLVIDSPKDVNDILPLRVPRNDERLIGMIGIETSEIGPLFSGSRLIPVHLLAGDLFASPPAAWETLDAIVLDESSFSRVNDEQRSAWLAAGITLAVKSLELPDKKWPWQRVGGLWVLQFRPAGPTNQLVNEAVYTPTFGWNPGWPAPLRAQVMGIALLIVLVSCAMLLLKNRFLLSVVLGFEITAAIGVAAWQHSMEKIDRTGGGIYLNRAGITQRDEWVFERAKQSATQIVNWVGWTHPIFSSANSFNQSEMTVHESSAGYLQFVYQAKSTHTMAFVRREIQPGEMSAIPAEHDSPMHDLAKSDYLGIGDRIIGEIAGANGRWPDVVIDQK
jgi:hypothetical protein